MITQTQYKGFNIVETSAGVFSVLGKDYGTIGAAKGAITRWVNANVEAVQKQEDAAFAAARPDDTAITFQNLAYDAKEAAHSAKVYAECVYHGLIKHGKAMVHSQKYLSRNKREGKYAGKAPTYNPKKRNGRIAGQHKRQGKDNVWPSNLR